MATATQTYDEKWARWQRLARELGLELDDGEGPDVDLDVQDAALIFATDDDGRAVVTMRVLAPTGTRFVFDMALEIDCVLIDDGDEWMAKALAEALEV